MEKVNLYHIDVEHEKLLNQIEDNDGEITEEMMNLLSVNEMNLQVQLVSVSGIVEMLSDRKEALIMRKKAFEEEIKKISTMEEKLKNRIAYYMEKYGIQKIESPECKITTRKSTSVVVEDVNMLPEQYVRVRETREPDKKAIKKAIEEGETFLGATLTDNINVIIK